ncbi:MAG: hypothetical protein WBB64_09240, partial [Anaerolineales bacterium]
PQSRRERREKIPAENKIDGFCLSSSPDKQKNVPLRSLCLVYCSQVLFLKKPAENYYVREWATIKLVGAHDNFSAGYKQLYCAF